MVRAAVRVTVGLMFALALGLTLAPLLWPAGAQTQDQVAFQLAQTLPTTTVPRTTTTATTAPPLSSSASITPTTKTTTTRPRVTGSTTTTSSTSTTTTSTTVAPLPTAPPAPVTLPLASAAQSGNISPFFSVLSGIGVVSFAALLTAQWFLTRPGRKGPTL